MTVFSSRALRFFLVVVIVQGVHVIEHVIQLVQVYALGIPDDQALGILGYVFQFQGTEEWLHFVFNATYLTSLYVLLVPLRRLVPERLPAWAFSLFVASVALESWHMVEHVVIISNVLAHGGCPCPGIIDAATGLSDTVLHFFYNLLAYAGVVAALIGLVRMRTSAARVTAGAGALVS